MEGEIKYIVMDGWEVGGIGWRRGRKQQLSKEIWGGTAKTNDHLRDLIETYYSRSFLKYIHILNLNVTRGHKAQTRHI